LYWEDLMRKKIPLTVL